jgi:hypothetical protein
MYEREKDGKGLRCERNHSPFNFNGHFLVVLHKLQGKNGYGK